MLTRDELMETPLQTMREPSAPVPFDFVDPEDPTTMEAGFQQENFVSAGATHRQFIRDLNDSAGESTFPHLRQNLDFNVLDYIPEEHKADFSDTYYELAHSPEEVEIVRKKIDRELREDRVLQESGIGGGFARVLASIAQPTNLIPGVVIWKAAKMGPLIARTASAATGAGLIGGTILAEEALLHQSQITRNLEESNVAVVAGTIMGAGFGWLFGKAPKSVLDAAEYEARQAIRGETKKYDIKGIIEQADPEVKVKVGEGEIEITNKFGTPAVPDEVEALLSKSLAKVVAQDNKQLVIKIDPNSYKAKFDILDCP